MKKPCFWCGVPVQNDTACPSCKDSHRPAHNPDRRRARPSRQERGYDAEYDRNSQIVIENARRYNLPCFKCGKHFGPQETITADHVIRLKFGGTNGLENLAPACTRCNYGWRKRRSTLQTALYGP